MARKATGAVIEHPGKDGRTYRALRFTAYGKRRHETLGPVTAEEADAKLRHRLADVERGIWKPASAVEAPPEPVMVPTFHHLAEQWWLKAQLQLAPKTRTDYQWRLERHLVPFFGDLRVDTISFDTVESYIAGSSPRALGSARRGRTANRSQKK